LKSNGSSRIWKKKTINIKKAHLEIG